MSSGKRHGLYQCCWSVVRLLCSIFVCMSAASCALTPEQYPRASAVCGGIEEDTLENDKPRNWIQILRPAGMQDIDLHHIKRIAVMISAGSSLIGSAAEGQLGALLQEKGFDVYDRYLLAQKSRKHLARQRIKDLTKHLEELDKEKSARMKASPNDGIREKIQGTIADLKKHNQEGHERDVVQIGKDSGLDAVITGTLFESRIQLGFVKDYPVRSVDKVGAASLHLQVVHMSSGKVPLTIIMRFERGEELEKAIDLACQYLVEYLRN